MSRTKPNRLSRHECISLVRHVEQSKHLFDGATIASARIAMSNVIGRQITDQQIAEVISYVDGVELKKPRTSRKGRQGDAGIVTRYMAHVVRSLFNQLIESGTIQRNVETIKIMDQLDVIVAGRKIQSDELIEAKNEFAESLNGGNGDLF